MHGERTPQGVVDACSHGAVDKMLWSAAEFLVEWSLEIFGIALLAIIAFALYGPLG